MRPAEHDDIPAAASRPRPLEDVAAAPPLWRHVLRRLGPSGALAAITALFPLLGGAALYGRLGDLAAWLRSGAGAAPLLCVAVFALAGGVAIMPTYAMSVVCGWAFGFTVGLGTTLCCFLGAALISYAIAAAADRGRTMDLISEVPQWRAMHRALARGTSAKLTAVVALIRLAPVTPFSLTSTAMGAFRVPLLPYLAGTLLGMAPRAVVVTYFASQLSPSSAMTSSPLGSGPWFLLLALATTVTCVCGMAWLGRRGLARIAAED